MSHYISGYTKRMTLMAEKGDTQLFEYLPSLFAPLAFPFEHLRLIRRLRFLYEYLHKGQYKVYYLAIKGEFVGYCVVTPGGRRLWLSGDKDVVLGPYYISPEYRGNGYAKILVKMTLLFCTYNYVAAYDWIHNKNHASIRTSEWCGFKFEGDRLEIVGLLRKIVPSSQGNYLVYKYQNEKS